MKPGKELNELIAEKVMKLKPCRHVWLHDDSGYYCSESCDGDIYSDYSTDIAAAWKVLEEIKSSYWTITLEDGYRGSDVHLYRYTVQDGIGLEDIEESYRIEGKTIPHAICLAALKVIS